jgi:trimeric autotransporter adhesin
MNLVKFFRMFSVLMLVLAFCASAAAQSTSFTYQGRLTNAGAPTDGYYDFQFTLWDSVSAGNQQPQSAPITVTRDNVLVAGGIFTTTLDFGADVFSGADRFLDISVRPHSNDPNAPYTTLTPRQSLTATPYAIRALTATTADNAQLLGGVSASGYVKTDDARLTDARPPTSDSTNYIQNTTAQQAAANFNIAGNGTLSGTLSAGVVNTTSGYNIGGVRVFSTTGTNNTFVGALSGSATTTGTNNSSFGFAAGFNNTSGASNSVFGNLAGALNSTGSNNTFVGRQAGASNTTGSNNTIIGSRAGVPSESNLNYASAIGAGAVVPSSDTIVLGKTAGTYDSTSRPADTVLIPGNLNVSGTISGTLPNIDASKITSGLLGVERIPDLGSSYVRNQTAQQGAANFNIAGNGTVGGTFTANSVSIQSGGGGFTLNDTFLRLRAANDNNHGLFYSTDVNGVEFRAFSGFRWTTGTSGATQRMVLDGTGQLIVGSKLWTMGGILARGGAPGANNLNNNGFAFQGSNGDSDSGLFSTADHQVSLYADNIERLRATNNETQIFGRGGVNHTYPNVSFNVRGIPADEFLFRVEKSEGFGALDVRHDSSVTVYGDFEVLGSKDFKIDHPLDPVNRNLRHNAVEGPGYYTLYHGTVTLDADGAAWVDLPSYFKALNGDTHYQLTCIGGYAQVYVATEVTNNRFQIAGGRPGLKISWQITADRHDPYARDHPYQAEVEKRANEKGFYLYPQGYGQPETLRVGGQKKTPDPKQ